MIAFFEMSYLASVKLFVAGIPESLGVLVFGIGLVGMAVLVRSLMARGETERTNEKVTKKA